MKCTLVSTLFVITNVFVAQAQVFNSSDTGFSKFSNDTISNLNGKLNTTNEIFNSSETLQVEIQKREITSGAVYDVGGWNGSLYRSNRSAVADHQPGRKQDTAISQITDGQVQATATTPATATVPSNTTYISSFEGAGMRMEPKSIGFVIGLAAFMFL
ncbi:YHR126C [Saccharomyces arboricola H-6]|uniref:YHR126C n=1 Tax=Saccharomyces arboricola (strain H-6 / AS 2.3317 / CBS 10644) TaxID=1160507 RepID=J8LMZ4_SACAR|nr:YHR126C [Saccharomyces arboricola H-6]